MRVDIAALCVVVIPLVSLCLLVGSWNAIRGDSFDRLVSEGWFISCGHIWGMLLRSELLSLNLVVRPVVLDLATLELLGVAYIPVCAFLSLSIWPFFLLVFVILIRGLLCERLVDCH